MPFSPTKKHTLLLICSKNSVLKLSPPTFRCKVFYGKTLRLLTIFMCISHILYRILQNLHGTLTIFLYTNLHLKRHAYADRHRPASRSYSIYGMEDRWIGLYADFGHHYQRIELRYPLSESPLITIRTDSSDRLMPVNRTQYLWRVDDLVTT